MLKIVNAQWTAQNSRDIAQAAPMLVVGVISKETSVVSNETYRIPVPKQQVPEVDHTTISAGACFCGQVKFELPIHLKPDISVVCHCTDCRQWHSVGSVPYMMFPLEELSRDSGKVPIKVIEGASLLGWVHRTPEVRRYFTTCCGTRVFNTVWNEKLGLRLCGTFPTLFPSYKWEPTMHVNVRESNYPLLDVVRWNDLPADYGGTGTHPL